MAELSSPSSTTVRKLFAVSSNKCAFPGCASRLVDTDTNTILAEICHIHAQSEGGPRFSPLLTREQVHSFENDDEIAALLLALHKRPPEARREIAKVFIEALESSQTT